MRGTRRAMGRRMLRFNPAIASVVTLAATLCLLACGSSSSSSGGGPPAVAVDLNAPLGETLSSTGFFGADVEPYDTLAPLWSDGADKTRFIRLPEGSTIDSSDMDNWRFPVGTTLWKEFTVDGRKVETRVLKKVGGVGEGGEQWESSAYAWNDAQTDAVKAPDGGVDASTGWQIPSAATCMECHGNLPGRVIGYSAVQVSAAHMASLVDGGRLSHAPAKPVAGVHEWTDNVAKKALLALHASCGHCHGAGGQGADYTAMDGVPGLSLRIRYDDRTVADTDAVRTAVGVPLMTPLADDVTLRIAPGDPEHSGLFHRMTSRGDWTQMPPLATNEVDQESAAAVNAWIASLHE